MEMRKKKGVRFFREAKAGEGERLKVKISI